MEGIITFEKGMQNDIDPTSMQKGAYIKAVNILRDVSGNVKAEDGIKTIYNGLSVVLGYTITNNFIVLAGLMSNIPTLVRLNEDDTYSVLCQNSLLGFTTISEVKLESKIDYKGNVILYIGGKNTPLSLINISESNPVPENLFLDYTLPKVTFNDIVTGGAVKTGVYQFAARLVTETNNKTGFCPVTGVIPIVDESPSVTRDDYDGAEPQTQSSNAISLTVSGIDTQFSYIEPCVITYVGTANQLSIRTLSLIPINDRSEISFIYTGDSDNLETLLPSELSVDAVSYTEANYMTQKDGTLILSGVTEKKDTTDWQAVANSIKLKYYISERAITEDINIQDSDGNAWDFDDDETSSVEVWTDVGESKGFLDYRNPKQVESFKTYRRGETYSFTFTPVFGATKGNAYHIPALHQVNTDADTSTKYLGSSVAQDFFYPESFGSLNGQSVRYHKMPTNLQESTTRYSNGITYIRLLGIEAEITIPGDSWKSEITGYIIGRESRTGKETVLAQGITRPLYNLRDNIYGIVPSFGNLDIAGVGDYVKVDDSKISRTLLTYHSPDMIIDKISISPKNIEHIEELSAEYKFATFGWSDNRRVNNFINCLPGTAKGEIISLYQGITTIPTQSLGESDRNSTPDFSVSVGLGGTESVRFQRLLECSIIRGLSDIPRNYTLLERWTDNEGDLISGEDEYYKHLLSTNSFIINLYNILQESRNYYGDVYNKESYPVGIVNFNTDNIDPETNEILSSSKVRFFNGDTFISKYAMLFKDTTASLGALGGDVGHVPRTNSMVYFYLESNNNYNYRHFNSAVSSEDATTLPYYPKNKIIYSKSVPLGELNYDGELGHPIGYNKQYSANNIIQPSYTKDIQQDDIVSFSNRSIYSSTSIEGENFDAYRLFLPSNYHDIPKQFGSITGSFVQGNELYFHTENCLWRSFYNTLATQATSEGDIVLGNGGAFSRPSVPIITQNGGYAGCLDIRSSIDTPNGRYFYDSNRSKLYYLASGLQEVSNPEMFNYMRSNFKGKDIYLGYDFGRKRLLMSGTNKTLSYSPELNSFSSEHLYYFKNIITIGNSDFIVNLSNVVGKYNTSTKNIYFGTASKLSIEVPFNEYLLLSKIFTNIEVVSGFMDSGTKVNKFDEFFDRFKAYTNSRNTGVVNLNVVNYYNTEFDSISNVSVSKVNDKYRFYMPVDVVYNPSIDINNLENLVTHSYFSDNDRLFRPEMIDNFVVLSFEYDNNGSTDILLKQIKINYDYNNI